MKLNTKALGFNTGWKRTQDIAPKRADVYTEMGKKTHNEGKEIRNFSYYQFRIAICIFSKLYA